MGFFSSIFSPKQETWEEQRAKNLKTLPSFLQLKIFAGKAYEDVWKTGKFEDKPDALCHAAAISNVFIALYEADPRAPTLPLEKMAEVVRFEASPFNILPPRAGRDALLEYVVWRQYPDKSDMKLLMPAINNFVSHLTDNDGDELLQAFRSESFAWIPWTRLLP